MVFVSYPRQTPRWASIFVSIGSKLGHLKRLGNRSCLITGSVVEVHLHMVYPSCGKVQDADKWKIIYFSRMLTPREHKTNLCDGCGRVLTSVRLMSRPGTLVLQSVPPDGRAS